MKGCSGIPSFLLGQDIVSNNLKKRKRIEPASIVKPAVLLSAEGGVMRRQYTFLLPGSGPLHELTVCTIMFQVH